MLSFIINNRYIPLNIESFHTITRRWTVHSAWLTDRFHKQTSTIRAEVLFKIYFLLLSFRVLFIFYTTFFKHHSVRSSARIIFYANGIDIARQFTTLKAIYFYILCWGLQPKIMIKVVSKQKSESRWRRVRFLIAR